MNRLAVLLACLLALPIAARAAATIPIVAAENFYGDIARQIGGDTVTVTSILSNPDEDPHLFEASPSVGRALTTARIAIASGAGYDPWMEKLLGATKTPGRVTIVVADLIGKKPGDNPHIWYDPRTMLALARKLAATLETLDPAHADADRQRLAALEASVRPIDARIAALRGRLAGTPVTATEPVFGYMFDAMGMRVRNMRFQLAVMNDTEPSAADVAAFERDLRTHQVKLLVYNAQASDEIAARMQQIAKASGVPIVGASETEPPDLTWQQWMTRELAAVDRALPPPAQ
jgi:zinc/manganese transport system substrate-binding protein